MPDKKNNSDQPTDQLVLTLVQPCEQIVVETSNSTYVFLWQSLFSARLIRCSNIMLDVGEVSLFGSYPTWAVAQGDEPISSGYLAAGEHMLFSTRRQTTEAGTPAVWTSPIKAIRWLRNIVPALQPIPGLRQPRSDFYQHQLQEPTSSYRNNPETKHNHTGNSPELWTPQAPHIPKSSPPGRLQLAHS